ncbi:uncharacterized protein LOC118196425 [Stegodyphus dumicola]|uniref:uncharacterized protein LOC118196425 n=1 Tax=Stegodyphus dumicola TaxID=202533 RepID=UPI0015AFBC13|nr:uncharacterized protein LOC118196425 [Stegodyphus dumicola]
MPKVMCTENLIPLVRSKPEIWDHSHTHYTSKDVKLQAWMYIANKLNSTPDLAKSRWTNLRDLFRRELKKSLKMAQETGDPSAYIPKWKHFKSMMFLKEYMVKDDNSVSRSVVEDSFSMYPQTILEDGENVEDSFYVEDVSTRSSTPSHMEMPILPEQSTVKRSNEDYSYLNERQSKKHVWNTGQNIGSGYFDYSTRDIADVDEDYHFVMSILPSVRRIRMDRKTSFKMKVLQLIAEEENLDST